jgi:hypothetical protein
MRKWIIVASLLAMAGCAAQRQKAFDEGMATCRATYPAVIGGYMALATCINGVSDRRNPGSDSQAAVNALRLSLAEQVDASRITRAEANAQLSRFVLEVNQRDDEINAQHAAAAAAILSAMPRPQPYVPPYQMPVSQPWSATCSRMGNFTTCNGN